MADRTITSDLIVAVDGSDEISVTVDPIRGLIKADKTFKVPAGFNIFHLFVDPELAAVSPYTASDNRPYIADDVTFSPETKATADADGINHFEWNGAFASTGNQVIQ